MTVLTANVVNGAVLTQIACPGGAGCTGPDYIVPAGQTVQGLFLRLDGQVKVEAGATFRDSQVFCNGSTARHGVTLDGVNNAKLINVDVAGFCGSGGHAGMYIGNGDGNEIWESRVRQSQGYGVHVDHATNTRVMGVFVFSAKLDQLFVTNSTGTDVASMLVYNSVTPGRTGIKFDTASTGNIVRSRSRFDRGEIEVPSLSTVGMTASVCRKALGATICKPGRYGAIAKHWTVCPVRSERRGRAVPSYQRGFCDFRTIDDALASANVQPGDTIVADVPIHPSAWSPITISKANLTLKSATCGGNMGGAQLGGAMKGRYGYNNKVESLTVSAPGVKVSGFNILGPVNVQPDTFVVEIQGPV